MSRAWTAALAILVCAAAVIAVAGCGQSDEKDVVEGEPVELGDLRINVQLTRFLNPSDNEDSEYLAGQPDPPNGKIYLAVFMQISNEGDSDATLPDASGLVLRDTTGVTYEPINTDNPFALQLGGTIPAGSEIPAPNTAAANGPIGGSMVLYLIDEASEQNRPLELEINADGERGTVKLDI